MTNAMLHGGGCAGTETTAVDGGLRIEVRDRSRVRLGRPALGGTGPEAAALTALAGTPCGRSR